MCIEIGCDCFYKYTFHICVCTKLSRRKDTDNNVKGERRNKGNNLPLRPNYGPPHVLEGGWHLARTLSIRLSNRFTIFAGRLCVYGRSFVK